MLKLRLCCFLEWSGNAFVKKRAESVMDIQQLLNEPEYDVKNFAV